MEKKSLGTASRNEMLELYDKTLENLSSIFNAFTSRNKFFIGRFKSTYYFAWKYLQSIIHELNITVDGNLYAGEEKTENASLQYSLHEICDLENLLASCINSKEKTLNVQLIIS